MRTLISQNRVKGTKSVNLSDLRVKMAIPDSQRDPEKHCLVMYMN